MRRHAPQVLLDFNLAAQLALNTIVFELGLVQGLDSENIPRLGLGAHEIDIAEFALAKRAAYLKRIERPVLGFVCCRNKLVDFARRRRRTRRYLHTASESACTVRGVRRVCRGGCKRRSRGGGGDRDHAAQRVAHDEKDKRKRNWLAELGPSQPTAERVTANKECKFN